MKRIYNDILFRYLTFENNMAISGKNNSKIYTCKFI